MRARGPGPSLRVTSSVGPSASTAPLLPQRQHPCGGRPFRLTARRAACLCRGRFRLPRRTKYRRPCPTCRPSPQRGARTIPAGGFASGRNCPRGRAPLRGQGAFGRPAQTALASGRPSRETGGRNYLIPRQWPGRPLQRALPSAQARSTSCSQELATRVNGSASRAVTLLCARQAFWA